MHKPQFILVLLLATVALYACNRDNEDVNSEAVSDFTSLKVDGVYMEDTESGGGFISGSNEAAISGDFADGSVLYILVDDAGTTGEYILEAATDDCVFTDAVGEIYSLSNPGSAITFYIDEIAATGVIRGLKGTFSGELFNDSGESVLITEGEFSDL